MPELLLQAYSAAWPADFESVRAELREIFGDRAPGVEHVGSTAVPGLAGKPVIDVLLQAASLEAVDACAIPLAQAGFERVVRHDAVLPGRRYFVRAAGAGPRVHLHAVVGGSAFASGLLAFRDALRADSGLAMRYAQLKHRLAQEHRGDPGRYTEGKAGFITEAIARN